MLGLTIAERPLSVGEPIRHPDLPAMAVSNEAERLGIRVVVAVARRRRPGQRLLSEQQGADQRRGPTGSSSALAGRGRTICGQQNQRPSSAAIDGIMNERTINVSNNRPRPIGVFGDLLHALASGGNWLIDIQPAF